MRLQGKSALITGAASIPLGRLSEPKDVASACVYLASEETEFVTGVVLEVDGGRTI